MPGSQWWPPWHNKDRVNVREQRKQLSAKSQILQVCRHPHPCAHPRQICRNATGVFQCDKHLGRSATCHVAANVSPLSQKRWLRAEPLLSESVYLSINVPYLWWERWDHLHSGTPSIFGHCPLFPSRGSVEGPVLSACCTGAGRLAGSWHRSCTQNAPAHSRLHPLRVLRFWDLSAARWRDGGAGPCRCGFAYAVSDNLGRGTCIDHRCASTQCH